MDKNRITWPDLFEEADLDHISVTKEDKFPYANIQTRYFNKRPAEVIALQKQVMYSTDKHYIMWMDPTNKRDTKYFTYLKESEGYYYYKSNEGYVIRAWSPYPNIQPYQMRWEIMYLDKRSAKLEEVMNEIHQK